MPATCSGLSLNGPFSFASVSSTTPQSANLAYPPCQTAQGIITPAGPKDIWFRLDPAFTDAVYRFTLYGTGSPSTTSAGMAVYEAPNATGPMRLLDCATGGAYDQIYNPSVEATCIAPGSKLYVRVWPRGSTAATANFNLCVMGQRTSTMPDRGADETACTARTVSTVGSFSTSGNLFNYVFACQEPAFLLANDNNMSGDLWVKLLIPTSGHVRLRLSQTTTPANMIGGTSVASVISGSLGMSAYLSTDCSDPQQFRQVGSTINQVTPASTGLPIDIKCLPAGAYLYVRFHSLSGSMTLKKRFGQFRFEWMAGSGSYVGYTPPSRSQPCGATALTVGATCAATTAGTTVDMCGAPGIPAPTCGGFVGGSQQSTWFKFIAPPSGMVVIDAEPGTAPAAQPAIALYASNALNGAPPVDQGCDLRLSLVDCDDRQGVGHNARIIQGGLYPGRVYYIRAWARSGTEGNFNICVTNPTPPAGSCWYMIDLYAKNTSGTLAMEVTIPPAPTVTYTTTGGDPSQSFMIAIPAGATANFHMVPSGGGIGTTGYVFWALWQVGSSDTLWYDDGGYAVAGPTPGPNDYFTLTNACSPRPHPRTDCFGMRTICVDGAGGGGGPTHLSGQFDNRSWPMSGYGPARTDYLGYTFHPHNGGMMDLAGANMGCLDGETRGIQWMAFRPQQDGTVAFLLQGSKVSPAPVGPADLDFALWDLGMLNIPGPHPDSINGYLVCPPASTPIRCSSARSVASTGLAPGMFLHQEGHGGWGWAEPLPVQNGHGYLIAFVAPLDTGRINYSLDWTMVKNTSGVTDHTILGCSPLLLPVELLFLRGAPRGTVVDLAWATASEMNSSHFVVERSGNGMDFTAIGRVAASGNTHTRVDYGFTDPSPLSGLNYYRLRAVDKDGTANNSNTVVVMMNAMNGKLLAYPNPVRDKLYVTFAAPDFGLVHMQVLDAFGRVVQQRTWELADGGNKLEVDTEMLALGTYMVRLTGENGSLIGSTLFVKN
jgi:hypothetical protein